MKAIDLSTLPPGPKTIPILQLARWILGVTPLLEECAKRYGDVFTLRLPVFGTFVVFASNEDILEIFRAPAGTYDDGGPYSFFAQAFGPESVQALTGEPHRHERALISPHLHGERMRNWGGDIAKTAATHFNGIPKNEPVSLLPIIERISFEISSSLAMGLAPGEQMNQLLSHLRRARHPMIDVLMRRFFSKFSPNPGRKEVLEIIEAEMLHRRSTKNSGAPRQDMLEVFLNAQTPQGKPMPDSQITAEVLTMLIAGYSSVAAATSWAISLILENPQVRTKIEEELESSSTADLTGNGYEYLDVVIKESLRIRPLVPMIFRRLVEPRQIGSYSLPAGVTLAPCIHLAHFRSNSWPDPQRFWPERFLGSGAVDQSIWLPFGGGHRRCIGASFALMEMRIVIATLMASHPVQLESQGTEESKRNNRNRFTRAPSSGLRVRFR